MQTYQKFMLTPGVQWPDGEFSPKASLQDAAEVIDREAYGEKSLSLDASSQNKPGGRFFARRRPASNDLYSGGVSSRPAKKNRATAL